MGILGFCGACAPVDFSIALSRHGRLKRCKGNFLCGHFTRPSGKMESTGEFEFTCLDNCDNFLTRDSGSPSDRHARLSHPCMTPKKWVLFSSCLILTKDHIGNSLYSGPTSLFRLCTCIEACRKCTSFTKHIVVVVPLPAYGARAENSGQRKLVEKTLMRNQRGLCI
jgi:hypothetical protein